MSRNRRKAAKQTAILLPSVKPIPFAGPPMPLAEVNRLRGMLEYRRPAWTQTEEDWIAKYIDPVSGVYADEYGNRIRLGTGNGAGAKVMISCHTDTVHAVEGMQRVSVSRGGVMELARKERVSNCLGADDGAGVYAALRMIEAGVDATFVFHRDEESGGKGSQWLAQNCADWLRTFDVCLALDRRGTSDVIVDQRWSKCASGEFARGLASELGMGHRAADGVFTDSANYTKLIAECSNLSVGYEHEHTHWETLDTGYLEAVIGKLIGVDWGKVPVVRVRGDDGYNRWDSGDKWTGRGGRHSKWFHGWSLPADVSIDSIDGVDTVDDSGVGIGAGEWDIEVELDDLDELEALEEERWSRGEIVSDEELERMYRELRALRREQAMDAEQQ